MTREDFENALCAKLEDIRNFYKQYNPEAFNNGTVYLYLTINGDGTVMANNAYWKDDNADYGAPVHCWTRKDGSVYHAWVR